ncbi:MAG: hypothetical protein MUO26_04710 [Methanotrichaceae archaeon]|nr:hypothetical protein [Methanotrichaceae archaeon]
MASSAALILITVIHMLPRAAAGDSQYLIFGRYIDPIVPLIFLMSFIGFYMILENKNVITNIIILKLGIIYFLMTLFLIIAFPFEDYKYPNVSAVYYIWANSVEKIFSELEPYLLLLLISLASWAFFYWSLKIKNYNYLIIYIIIISILISIPMVSKSMLLSAESNKVNEIGKYLEHRANENTTIIMDDENLDLSMFYRIIFWTDAQVKNESINLNSLSAEKSAGIKYLVSKKELPFQKIIISRSGYAIYDITTERYCRFCLGSIDGFYDIESWGGIPTQWIKDGALLYIYLNKNASVDLNFRAKSFRVPRIIQIEIEDNQVAGIAVPNNNFIQIAVPLQLIKGYNIIKFRVPEGCERSMDWEVESKDSRCLSMAIRGILVNETNQ